MFLFVLFLAAFVVREFVIYADPARADDGPSRDIQRILNESNLISNDTSMSICVPVDGKMECILIPKSVNGTTNIFIMFGDNTQYYDEPQWYTE